MCGWVFDWSRFFSCILFSTLFEFLLISLWSEFCRAGVALLLPASQPFLQKCFRTMTVLWCTTWEDECAIRGQTSGILYSQRPDSHSVSTICGDFRTFVTKMKEVGAKRSNWINQSIDRFKEPTWQGNDGNQTELIFWPKLFFAQLRRLICSQSMCWLISKTAWWSPRCGGVYLFWLLEFYN